MSTVIATSVLPDSTANDTLTIGAAGDSVAIGGSLLQMNTLQDAGGNTIFVSNGSGTITSTGFTGAIKFISSQTASGSASLSFTSGLDSTYDVYVFKFIEINPATDSAEFTFNLSSDGGSNYNVTKTTTSFWAENGASALLEYRTGDDLQQSTSFQVLAENLGNGSAECAAGELHLFNPASTTYVKHFYATIQYKHSYPMPVEMFISGYGNTTSAVNAIQFKMDSGNFDGTIALYGISKS